MPIYMYRCSNCEFEFEQRQRMSDDPLTDCPSCADGRVRRVVNSIGVVFKGSGFYVTDSRSKSNGTSHSAASKSSTSETESTSNTTTNSNTESKPEKSKSEKKETTPATT